MWEILTRKVPYDDCLTKYMYEFAELVRNGRRPTLTETLTDDEAMDYIELMKQCWDGDPQTRPMFGEIVTRLDLMQETSVSLVLN
jgi:hypothetical protein